MRKKLETDFDRELFESVSWNAKHKVHRDKPRRCLTYVCESL